MQKFIVKVGSPGGGSGTFEVEINAPTPDKARDFVEHQYPGMVAQSVRAAPKD